MEQQHFKVFAHRDVPRLRYILNIIFCNILGMEYEIVTDRRKLGKSPSINYSDENITGSFKISPHDLLFESEIKKYDIESFNWKDYSVFFPSTPDSDFPFDLFAVSFYLITRYEEYLSFIPDEHGRFREEESVSFKLGFLHRPVIDLYARELSLLLLKKFHNLTFKRHEFKALMTIDVDQPFAYVGKGFFRSFAGIIRDSLNSSSVTGERLRCLTGRMADPYDIFDYITENVVKNRAETIFFFPVGRLSEFDKNPGIRSRSYRNLIKRISSRFRTGIHPSYLSALKPALLKAELRKFKIVGSGRPEISRQHYLKIRFPESYINLINSNILEDYSLGYVREPGFRAGIARPFRFFDLVNSKETNLTIVPFQIMDGALLYKNNDPQKAIEMAKLLIDETRMVGGLFVSIWHNTSLTEKGEWRDWRKVFEFILKYQRK